MKNSLKHLSCENYKGPKDQGKCPCKKNNRKWARELKLYKQFMKNLESR